METRQAAKLVERIIPVVETWVKDPSPLDDQFGDVLLELADGIREKQYVQLLLHEMFTLLMCLNTAIENGW